MKTFFFSVLLFAISSTGLNAQYGVNDSLGLVKLNQDIDNYVVAKNVNALDSLYASDFVFSHGSGKVEGKEGWLKSVGRNNYPQRQHDSVKVELHPQVAILKGKMVIHRVDKDKTAIYRLNYIRVYAWRTNRWQLISHSTTKEVHDN